MYDAGFQPPPQGPGKNSCGRSAGGASRCARHRMAGPAPQRALLPVGAFERSRGRVRRFLQPLGSCRGCRCRKTGRGFARPQVVRRCPDCDCVRPWRKPGRAWRGNPRSLSLRRNHSRAPAAEISPEPERGKASAGPGPAWWMLPPPFSKSRGSRFHRRCRGSLCCESRRPMPISRFTRSAIFRSRHSDGARWNPGVRENISTSRRPGPSSMISRLTLAPPAIWRKLPELRSKPSPANWMLSTGVSAIRAALPGPPSLVRAKCKSWRRWVTSACRNQPFPRARQQPESIRKMRLQPQIKYCPPSRC